MRSSNQLETWTSYVSLQKNTLSECFRLVTSQLRFFYPEVCLEPYETSKMKLFAKIGNDFKSLFILGKRSILDV